MKSSKMGPVSFASGIVAAAALLLSVNVSADIVIDDFIDQFVGADGVLGSGADDYVIATGVGNEACGYASESRGNILGGERDASIVVDRGDNSVIVKTVADSEGTRLSISMDDGTAGTVAIQWDGVETEISTSQCGLSYTGLGGVNLAANGGSKFRLKVYSSDAASTVVIYVYTSSTRWSRYALAVPDLGTEGPGQTFDVLFSRFEARGSNGGVDFGNVGAIVMEVQDAPRSLDLSFDWLGWVVTPVTYNNAFDRVKQVEDGVVFCWETTMEDNVEGFFYGKCPQNMQDCVIQYVEAKGLSNGAPYCETISGMSMKNGDQYGVVNVDRDFTAGDIHWMNP